MVERPAVNGKVAGSSPARGAHMTEFQEEYSFQCPYCASMISIVIDLTAGREQSFTTDCEVCCRPISVTAMVDEEGVSSFEAEKES